MSKPISGTVFVAKRSGIWYVSYPHPETGKRVRETSGSRHKYDAEELLKKRLAGDTGRATTEPTVADLLDDLFRELEIRQVRSLYEAKSHAKFIYQRLGQIEASQLSASRIQRYIKERLAEGRAKATINREVHYLRQAYNVAMGDSKIQSAPRFTILNEKDNVRTGFLTEGDLQKIAEHLLPQYRDILWFAFYSCWRKGEILKLEWSEVNMKQELIVLSPAKVKNRETRSLPLEDELLKIIKRRHKERNGSDYVFHKEDGEPLGEVYNPFRTAFNKAGYEGNVFHDIRRSGIRRLILAGVPQITAQKISGHRDANVFKRYAILEEDDLRDAMRRASEYHSTKEARRTLSEGEWEGVEIDFPGDWD